ncbi:MscL family protein [bacterium]|nr:MscL family protein [bacterium]
MILKDYIKFLKEYKIISLALAFIMGAASTSLVNSLVKDIIMPLFSPVLNGDLWKEAVLSMGSIQIRYGAFLAELFNFIILGLVVFFIAKKILKEEKIKKK